jgi:hypothetical protein
MVCFVNVQGADRIIYSIFFRRFKLTWNGKTAPSSFLHTQLDIALSSYASSKLLLECDTIPAYKVCPMEREHDDMEGFRQRRYHDLQGSDES